VVTRGTTPQKAGAMMLVFDEGSQLGTLGGGCVEAEVKRRAMAVISAGVAEICRFQLDNDYGWDDGLICGGRMQVLIEPLGDQAAREYAGKVVELADGGRGLTEAIVFDAQASGLPCPSAYLFGPQGELVSHLRGPLDGGAAPAAVRERLRPLDQRPQPYIQGGVAYLPLLPRCRLVIVGGGHVGQAVAQLAADLDFDIWVVDDRESIVSEERFPRAERRVAGAIPTVLPELEITPSTYCLIVTRGHNHDEEALFHLIDRGAAYVGMIGSRRKIRLIFDDLLNEGVSAESLRRVHAPVGLDIGSQTVPEIAVSIAAELVAHRNLPADERIGRTLQREAAESS
jgi:xanthine dehydrogenase accessory factor